MKKEDFEILAESYRDIILGGSPELEMQYLAVKLSKEAYKILDELFQGY